MSFDVVGQGARLVVGVQLPRSAFWTRVRREKVCPQHGERPGLFCSDCGVQLQEREVEEPTDLLWSLIESSEKDQVENVWRRLTNPYSGQILSVVKITSESGSPSEFVLGKMLAQVGVTSTRGRHALLTQSKIEDKANEVRALLAERNVLGSGRHVAVHLVLG